MEDATRACDCCWPSFAKKICGRKCGSALADGAGQYCVSGSAVMTEHALKSVKAIALGVIVMAKRRSMK